MNIRPDEKIRDLVRLARRRFFFNVAVAQGVLAASVGMGGAILILVFGAQLLDWRWLALISAITFPVAYFRTSRRVPSLYRVAQIVDDRLSLRDSLSTALYFSESSSGQRVSGHMREAQLAESERISREVDPRVAVPLAAPRLLYVFGALFLAALALFGVRYGFERSMDLNKPLARILMDALGGGFEQHASLNKKEGGKNPWDQQAPTTISLDDRDPEAQGKLDEAPPSVLDTIDVPDVNNVGAKEAGATSKGKSDNSGAEGERAGDDAEESESAPGSASSKDSDQAGSKQGDASAGKQAPNSNAENSSLASKIKDAMSNLLASMKPQNNSGNQPPPGQNGNQQKGQQAKGDQKGAMGQGQKKSGEQSSDSQDGQSSDDADSGKSAEGKSSGKSSDEQASHNPGSGIGKQDGAKDAKLAEQLAAMGKISEIIGKRSANVTGEVTVEVNTSKQQLKTAYSETKASHGEAGGEINRDEVPVAFQQYVQEYFSQVRKQSAAPKGTVKNPAAVKETPAAAPAPPTQ